MNIKKNNAESLDDAGIEVTRNIRGFMHQLNEISQAFINFAAEAPGSIVDMGVAYGIATIPILKKHIKVIACDLEQAHLDELIKRIDPPLLPYLITKQGNFPVDFDFENQSIGSILFSHVLHFLNPEELNLAFDKLAKWLAPGGKVFIVTYTPYISALQNFIPVYEQRVASGIEWPFWVENNIRDHFIGPQEIADNLPPTMNNLDLPPLINALRSRGFTIEKGGYLDATINHIPPGVILDGREWCGVIAKK